MGENILFEHNLKAYRAVVSMLLGTGRAAVVHPTGTGKSFIAFQLCADNPDKTVCWLSPSSYIFRTQREKWSKAGGIEMGNIKFFTYARLMRMKEEESRKIKPQYIVLDEFHRCGAARWGAGVKALMQMYPQAKVLGLSATNIRYLDNRRDMAWELFGGNIASELTLGAAVALGILPAPKYVLSIYSYRRELEKYKEKVRRVKNPKLRDAALKEIEALRRALERADGLEEVFAKHMLPNRNDHVQETEKPEVTFGKYIVFCADYRHLEEMRALAEKWFVKVDPEPHIYTAYSDDPETSVEFDKFKNDRSAHLKLLYCIDMLNEGIHVDGVDGVILLRPTVSPAVYKQQVGRALSAGGENTPVIFDIVMNIENLCSVGAIEEEERRAVLRCHQNGENEPAIRGHFRVVDEVKDCRRLFGRLNELLSASWEAMYTLAEEYYRTYGDLLVPAAYVTPDGYSLGAWVATQRKVYLGKTAGRLDEGQIQRLEGIGMCWEGTRKASWEKNFLRAEGYFMEHGSLSVPADYVAEDGCKLGRWIRRQKELYRKILASPDMVGNIPDLHRVRLEKLVQIGLDLDVKDSWEKKYELAKKYYEEHGNLRMPGDYVVEGVWLERWLRQQKAKLMQRGEENSGELTEERKEKLYSIGLRPGVSKAEISWREQYEEAVKFYLEHGNLSIPKRYLAGGGKNLGIWLQHQREGRRKGMLAGWQVTMLDGIGMVWEFSDAWENGYAHAEEYFKQMGDLKVPNAYVCPDGYRLGKWISNQRCAYRGIMKKGLTAGQVERLLKIGMVWCVGQGKRTADRVKHG